MVVQCPNVHANIYVYDVMFLLVNDGNTISLCIVYVSLEM